MSMEKQQKMNEGGHDGFLSAAVDLSDAKHQGALDGIRPNWPVIVRVVIGGNGQAQGDEGDPDAPVEA